MSTVLTNLRSLAEVMAAALVLGAGLPMFFALGVRLWSAGAGADGAGPRRPVVLIGAYLCLFAVLAVVVAGVLFVAKGFLAQRLGIHLFGQA